jgi:opacity protein-like surface antigen
VQAGYLFKAALAGKDVLGYVEVGPHFAFTKLSVETRATDANLYRIAASNDAFAYAVARDPILEKRQKSSVDVGIALGTGAKVAVSKNMFMSLGYRFTKVRGQKELKENKVKIPSQSHTILWGLVYSW